MIRPSTSLKILPIVLAALFAVDGQADTASSSINISATVVENCLVSATAVDFGTYDPIVANATDPLLGTGAVNVTCTSGTEANVVLMQSENGMSDSPDGAAHRMSDNVGSEIIYALYSDPGRSVVWGGTAETGVSHIGTGQSTELIVYGNIAPGQDLPEGNYSAAILATVIF